MSDASQARTAEQPSPWLVLVVVVAGAFVAILANTLLNVALPKLMVIFGVTTDEVQWVLTAFMLTSGVVVPITGYLGDTIGYKKVYVLATGIFTIGSFLCMLAWSNSSLIFFRVIQAIGGGVIMPISMVIIYQTFPKEKIGTALGMWGIAAMVAPSIGPTLSGYLIDAFSWRVLFGITFPIGALATILAVFLLKETPTRPAKFDFWGFVLCTSCALSILLALSEGHSKGWGSFYIVSLFYIAAVTFVLFVIVELSVEQPMLDLRILKIPRYSASVVISSLVTMGMFGGMFLTPIYLQNLKGLTPLQTGLLLMPQALTMAVLMPIAGKLFDKIGPVPLGLVGLADLAFFTFELTRLDLTTSIHWVQLIMTLRAIGIALCMMPISTAGMNAVPPHLTGRASSLQNVMRQIAGSLGIAVLTSIMTQRQVYHQAEFADAVSLTSQTAVATQQHLAQMFNQMPGGGGETTANLTLYGLAAKQALVQGIDDAFFVAAIPVVLAIPLVLTMIGRKKRAAQRRAPEMAKQPPGSGKPAPTS